MAARAAVPTVAVAMILSGCGAPIEDDATAPAPPAAAPSEPPDDPLPASLREASVESRELDYPALRDCGVVNAGRWTASIEESAEEAQKAVLLRGFAGTNPSVDFEFVLDPDIMESSPVQRRARMIATHPEGDNIDRLDEYRLEARLAYEGEFGILRLECGGVLMATIRDPAETR